MVLKDLDIAMVTMALASMLNVQTIGMSDENLAPVFPLSWRTPSWIVIHKCIGATAS